MLEHGTSVRFFESLGRPSPSVLALTVGALELGAATLLLLDRATRIAALVGMPITVVAAVTAGPAWQSVSVLTAALILVAIETSEGRGHV